MRLQAKMTVYDALLDRSGTIVTAGVAQTLMPANPDRCYLVVQNISNSDLWIRDGALAAIGVAGSIRITPGGEFAMQGSFVPSQFFTVIGPVSGQAYTAKENQSSYGNVTAAGYGP